MPSEPRRGHLSSSIGLHRLLCITVWVLGTKREFSARSAGALNHRAISLGPDLVSLSRFSVRMAD